MPVKVTLEFSQSNYSWTEAHYFLPGSTLQSAVISAQALARARAAFLGMFSYLNTIRLSTVPASRYVEDIIILGGLTGFFKGEGVNNDPYDSEFPNVALLVQMAAGSGPNKNLYLAGIPAAVPEVSAQGRGNYSLQDPNANAALQAYLNLLAPPISSSGIVSTSLWGYRQRAPAGAQTVKQISSVGTSPALIVLTAPTIAGLSAGSEVYLTGFRRVNTGAPGLSGIYSLADFEPTVPAGPNSLYTLNGTGNVSATNFEKPGQINALNWSYLPYQSWSIVRIVSRKRGGSLGLPRGRRKARR